MTASSGLLLRRAQATANIAASMSTGLLTPICMGLFRPTITFITSAATRPASTLRTCRWCTAVSIDASTTSSRSASTDTRIPNRYGPMVAAARSATGSLRGNAVDGTAHHAVRRGRSATWRFADYAQKVGAGPKSPSSLARRPRPCVGSISVFSSAPSYCRDRYGSVCGAAYSRRARGFY